MPPTARPAPEVLEGVRDGVDLFAGHALRWRHGEAFRRFYPAPIGGRVLTMWRRYDRTASSAQRCTQENVRI
jgi:hypothetical protein